MLIKPIFKWEEREKKLYFGFDYLADNLRPLIETWRNVYEATNGWKIIIGFNAAPWIWSQAKAIYFPGLTGEEVEPFDDELSQIPAVNSLVAGYICDSATEAINEANRLGATCFYTLKL